MKVNKHCSKMLLTIGGVLLSQWASAHISVSNKIYSNAYSEIQLAVGHGCEGFDTVKIEVTLPEGLTGVRPADSTFGLASVEKNEADVITKITWTSAAEVPHASDSHAYNFLIRAKTPDAPFRALYFPTVQTCKDLDGNVYTSEWVGMEGHDHDSTSEVLPAPSTVLLPKVSPGWSQFLTNEHIHDLSIFNDAEIVWFGTSAYSANATTLKLIQDDPAVTVIEQLHPGSEIWVKY